MSVLFVWHLWRDWLWFDISHGFPAVRIVWQWFNAFFLLLTYEGFLNLHVGREGFHIISYFKSSSVPYHLIIDIGYIPWYATIKLRASTYHYNPLSTDALHYVIIDINYQGSDLFLLVIPFLRMPSKKYCMVCYVYLQIIIFMPTN